MTNAFFITIEVANFIICLAYLMLLNIVSNLFLSFHFLEFYFGVRFLLFVINYPILKLGLCCTCFCLVIKKPDTQNTEKRRKRLQSLVIKRPKTQNTEKEAREKNQEKRFGSNPLESREKENSKLNYFLP